MPKKSNKTKNKLKKNKKKTKKFRGGFTQYFNWFDPFKKDLPKDWHEYKNANGETFYYNSLTKRFQKEFPESVSEPIEAARVLNEKKGENIPVVNCECSKGVGKDKLVFLANVDKVGNIYVEKGANLSSIYNKSQLDNNSSTISNCGDNCKISDIDVTDNNSSCWGIEQIVSSRIAGEQSKNGANPNEFILGPSESKLGGLGCDGLKEKIKKIFGGIIPYKNCQAFRKIDTIKILGNELKKTQLGIIPFIFDRFDNIKIIELEMEETITGLSDNDRECMDLNYNINYSGNKIIATQQSS